MVKVKKTRPKKRSMQRQMRRMGVDLQQMDGVTEVLIRFPEKELVLNEPQVVMMQAQGENIYQIIGEAEERAPTLSSDAPSETPTLPVETFSEEDVKLVASQANVTEDEARTALQAAKGNLAKAIIDLTGG